MIVWPVGNDSHLENTDDEGLELGRELVGVAGASGR